MTARFHEAGYEVVPSGQPSDIAIIHGCAITGKAEHSSLYAARQARRLRQDALIILAGCPAETLGDTLRGDTVVDLTIGQEGKFSIPDILHKLDPTRFPHPGNAKAMGAMPQFDTQRALIKVQDGCDFKCAYCIVPAARGAPHSRPLAEIVTEVQRITEAGFKEIILTGANLGRYADGNRRLVDLVQAIEAMPDVKRIRLSSIEITTAENDIIKHMASSAKLCHFLHIPLQSGDNAILAAMGRRYNADLYRKVVEDAAMRMPTLGLGTDIIVGFPGESDQAFSNTLNLVRDLPFSNIHVFPYSRRQGTRADTMPNQIQESVKKQRLLTLAQIGESKRLVFADQFIGKTVSILIEGFRDDGSAHGWTGEYVAAQVTGSGLERRQIVTMTVTRVCNGTLHGTLS